jgi:hypothetical protein
LVGHAFIATETPQTKSASLSVKIVLAGALAGVLTGLFFGGRII